MKNVAQLISGLAKSIDLALHAEVATRKLLRDLQVHRRKQQRLLLVLESAAHENRKLTQ